MQFWILQYVRKMENWETKEAWYTTGDLQEPDFSFQKDAGLIRNILHNG